jgi:hypothetical protein
MCKLKAVLFNLKRAFRSNYLQGALPGLYFRLARSGIGSVRKLQLAGHVLLMQASILAYFHIVYQ